jgi:hypothetical protein
LRLSRDLLELADHLARRERRRPRQSSLRRSVSTTYYALFHFLVDQSTRGLFGGSPQTSALRVAAARAFQHGDMRRACTRFRSSVLGRPPGAARSGSPNVPSEVRSLAEAFVVTQEERHKADYDTGARFTRSQALALVQRAREDMNAWMRARNTPVAERFLLDLLIGGRPRAS